MQFLDTKLVEVEQLLIAPFSSGKDQNNTAMGYRSGYLAENVFIGSNAGRENTEMITFYFRIPSIGNQIQ